MQEEKRVRGAGWFAESLERGWDTKVAERDFEWHPWTIDQNYTCCCAWHSCWDGFTAAVSAAVLGEEGLPADTSQASIYGREMAPRSFTNGASRREMEQARLPEEVV